MAKRLICLVRYNKANNHKYITIPKDEQYKAGDYVEVIPLAEPVTGDVTISTGGDSE